MDERLARYEVPVSEGLVREIYEMWKTVPENVGIGQDIAFLRDQLTDRARKHSRKLLYVARQDGEVAGTSMLWISRRDPSLCEFGLPATAPEFRRRGIGQALFDQPVADFRAMHGKAIFLGTNHLQAGRVYYRAGYRKLVGSMVLVNVLSGESPEAFLVDYFRGLGPATVSPGVPDDQTPAVPLLVSPHDWQVLDANVPTHSRRYFLHRTFAGLAGRYVTMVEKGGSAFFAARTGGDKVVGLATARMDDGLCSVDGFTHRYYLGSWEELIESAMSWGSAQGASSFYATLSIEDYEKKALFEGLGFREAGPAGEFFLDGVQLREHPHGRPVGAVRMTRS